MHELLVRHSINKTRAKQLFYVTFVFYAVFETENNKIKVKMFLTNLIVFLTIVLCVSSAKIIDDGKLIDAKKARHLVHKSNWTSMGTISTADNIIGYPMVNLVSIADSPLHAASTGHIYYLLTDLDFTGKDLKANQKLTALFSNDQDLSCTIHSVDPMEPTCTRVIITGYNIILNKTLHPEEYEKANVAITSRHPASISWRKKHNFYLSTVSIEQVVLLDYYGGAKFIKPKDYYAANDDVPSADEYSENDIDYRRIPMVLTPKKH